MPTIKLDRIALIELQNRLRNEGFESPDSLPTREEWIDQKVTEAEEAGEEPNVGLLAEDYSHVFGIDRALRDVLEACPICGDTECDRGVAWIGASPIHADEHPEAKAERAMDN